MSKFNSTLEREFSKLTASEKKIISEVWGRRDDYIRWPARARLLWPGCVPFVPMTLVALTRLCRFSLPVEHFFI